MKVESPDAPLLQQEVDKKVTQLRNEADQALASAKQNQEIDDLLAEVSRRQADWGFANALVEEREEAVELEEARVKGVQPPPKKLPKEKDPYRETLKGLGPFPGYCSHPMDKAWREGVPSRMSVPRTTRFPRPRRRLPENRSRQRRGLPE
jgi:hypothetical protein